LLAVLARTLVRRRIGQDFRFDKLVPSAALGQIGRVLSRFRRRVRAAATVCSPAWCRDGATPSCW